MHSTSVLIYRYAFGCLAMLGMLMFHRTRMWLAFGDFLRILLLFFDVRRIVHHPYRGLQLHG